VGEIGASSELNGSVDAFPPAALPTVVASAA
jgi:hypothetical protein